MTRKSVTISTSGRKMKGTQNMNATKGFYNLIHKLNEFRTPHFHTPPGDLLSSKRHFHTRATPLKP